MKIYIADAFADQPYTGNPAGVCVLPEEKPDEWMRNIAAEMGASETAFLVRENGGFALRWFTPEAEVPLCGHATLASAHILWETGAAQEEKIRFQTKSGQLTAVKRGSLIELDFPAMPTMQADAPDALIRGIGATPLYVGASEVKYLVEVEDERTVRGLSPDFAAIKQSGRQGVIVTARADAPGVDFVSRFFAPAVGVDEDPVTGSAHCCLAPYWGEKLGKKVMKAKQLSRRGGSLEVEFNGDRVLIRGRAVTTLRGQLAAE